MFFFVLTNRSFGSRLPRNGSIGTHVHRGSTRMVRVREIQHLFESPTKPRVKLDLIETIQLFRDVLGFWVQMLHHPESKMPEIYRFFHEKKCLQILQVTLGFSFTQPTERWPSHWWLPSLQPWRRFVAAAALAVAKRPGAGGLWQGGCPVET